MYNLQKLKEFHDFTIEDYNRSLIIEDIATVKTVEKADDSFIQIGMRPLMDDDMFLLPNFDPRLPSAGMMVAVGEEDFLVGTILDDKEIERIEIKENMKEFPKYIDFNDAIILLSTKFFVETFTQLMHRIDYGGSHPTLDNRYRIITVPEKILGNKIIIIGKDAVLWEKQLFIDKITGKKEKIDISIKPASIGKVDITIRSVNKIRHIDFERIKILEVKEQDGKKD